MPADAKPSAHGCTPKAPTLDARINKDVYSCHMALTPFAAAAREAIASHRAELNDVLLRYNAHNPRLFGSVARGDATANSDIDVIVDLAPMPGNSLMRLAGLSEEFRRVLGLQVDVVAADLLREKVSDSALADAVAL